MRRPATPPRDRDFTTLWVGQTVSSLGSTVSAFVFPLIAFALTGSTAVAAIAEAAHLLGRAAALLPAGALADRVHLGRLMRASSGLGAALYLSLALAAATHHLTVPHLVGVALLTGIAAGTFAPAEAAAVRRVVARVDLPTALARNEAREHVASLVGAPLGGLLYSALRWLPFAADAVSYAVSWVALGRLRTDLSPEPAAGLPDGAGAHARRRGLADGARFVLASPLFRTLLVWSALTNLLVNALFFTATLRLVAAGFDPVQIGLVDTVAGAAGITGALVAPRIIDRMPTGRLTVLIAWSFVPLVVPLALWNRPLVMAAAVGVVLLLNPAGNAGMGAYRTAVTPPDVVGRTQAFSQFASFATMPLAPLVAGGALALLGGPAAILALGAATGAVALIPTLSPVVRSVPRPREWSRAVVPDDMVVRSADPQPCRQGLSPHGPEQGGDPSDLGAQLVG